MKEKILELIWIGSRKVTNDNLSNYRALRFIDLVSEEEYIMHLRDDEVASKLLPQTGDIWTGLDFLCLYCSHVKNPTITLGSEFMRQEGLLARVMHQYHFIGKDEKTLVFRNYNSLLSISRNGVSKSFRIIKIVHYNTTEAEIETLQSLTQNEIATKFFINLKKYI